MLRHKLVLKAFMFNFRDRTNKKLYVLNCDSDRGKEEGRKGRKMKSSEKALWER